MKIAFSIKYNTGMGSSVFISGAGKGLGEWSIPKALRMKYEGSAMWSAVLDLPDDSTKVEYNYVHCNEDGTNPNSETGEKRLVEFEPNKFDYVELVDSWQAKDNNAQVLTSSAFKNVIFKREVAAKKFTVPVPKSKTSKVVVFEITTPKILPGHSVAILGSTPELDVWDADKAIPMVEVKPYTWKVALEFSENAKIEYKYAITVPKKSTNLETGDNRVIDLRDAKKSVIYRKDQAFNYSNMEWKGAGVAIPVFSLRTKKSFGVGDFADIKALVDWCKEVGINMIQLLPVNDTVSTHTWTDSYPYGGISVFALHPMFISIDALGELPFGITNEILKERKKVLNAKKGVDYEAVMNIKSRIYKMAYDIQKDKVFADPDYIKYFKENEEWLFSYAAYSYLRDLYGTPDYNQWGQYAVFNKKKIDELVAPGTKHYDEIAIHYYIQYQLHKQLVEASCYARANGVFLKGDLPIGVIRFSVDAWSAPNLYHMDAQAGAPPDDYAADGQNWGFPTYNWDEMAKDNYKWWRGRLTHMSQYFDAYRIDHLLGFFRIWQIPYNAISGLLGNFSPALPISKDEITSAGLPADEKILCDCLITRDMIVNKFKGSENSVISSFLKEISPGKYALKDELKTQRQIDEYFYIAPEMSEAEKSSRATLRKGLQDLLVDVLFIKDKNKADAYHPRIEIAKTESFKRLDGEFRKRIYDLYLDYFYKRQEGLWREQAMVKLPALTKATNMLVCGEDLGMVPECVPGVMDELGILSLKIQRMPKENYLTFGQTQNYPYMSVCTASCHDMSTVRGWWEEDRAKTQKYYNEVLKCGGDAPYYCEPWIVEKILVDHLNSPSMWAVFPIQDLIGIDGKLRVENPNDERINVPSIPKHYWKYRFHMDMEDLMKQKEFNSKLKSLVLGSGRSSIIY